MPVPSGADLQESVQKKRAINDCPPEYSAVCCGTVMTGRQCVSHACCRQPNQNSSQSPSSLLFGTWAFGAGRLAGCAFGKNVPQQRAFSPVL
jgi:hypothetical protein